MGKFSHRLTQNLQVCHDDYLEKVNFFDIKCIPAQRPIFFFPVCTLTPFDAQLLNLAYKGGFSGLDLKA